MEDSSISPAPSTTVPSTGSTLPAPRWSTMPRVTSSVRTRTSWLSTTAQTLSARTTMPSRSARWARLCTCSSMREESSSRKAMVPASAKLPRAMEVAMAVASRTSTVTSPASRCRSPSATNPTARTQVSAARAGMGRRTRFAARHSTRRVTSTWNRLFSRQISSAPSRVPRPGSATDGRRSGSSARTAVSTSSRQAGSNVSRMEPLAAWTSAVRTPPVAMRA